MQPFEGTTPTLPSNGRDYGTPLKSNVNSQYMLTYRAIDVKDCQGTLWALYREFQDQALASFEGDLSGLHLSELQASSMHETMALKRQTSMPEMDFCVVPINSGTVGQLKTVLSSKGLPGHDGRIIHTQLQVKDELIFSACDNFHNECTVMSTSVPEEFLMSLIQQGLLRSYSAS